VAGGKIGLMDHTFFLWGSYAFTAAVIAVELVSLYLRRKKALFLAKSQKNESENS
jgi:heme exporter protein CcmD